MISIFNGQERGLEANGQRVFVRVSVEMRDHLKKLKGARLGVFLCIALHSDESGWSFPSIPTICRLTGYERDAVKNALRDLRKLEINGQRVMLSYQIHGDKGAFSSNQYLLFPSKEEIAKFEGGEHAVSP